MTEPRRTAGGTFDPDARPVYFAAGHDVIFPKYALVATNDLMADGGDQERELDQLLDDGHLILLDSGIFNLTNNHKRLTGCTMDEALALAPDQLAGFDDLFARYVTLAQRYGDRLWGYIELDQGGAVNKRRTRERLHDLGLSPIPVYHPLVDGWDYFDELATGYDRICFGNVVQAQKAVRVRLMHTLWERRRQYPDLWVHVLGLTANEWCLAMPPDSCDSSSWLNPLRYPTGMLATGALRTLGSNFPTGLRYDLADSKNPERGRVAALQLLADVAGMHDRLFHAQVTDRVDVLGTGTHPPRHPDEGELAPC